MQCPKCKNYEWDKENVESPSISAESFVQMFNALANNKNVFPVEDTNIPILDSESSD